MDLFEEPNVMDMLITNLAEKKSLSQEVVFFQLKIKIKTMRLLDNEIKMVYNQNNNAEFERGDSEYNENDEYELIKLSEEGYHEKIRTAINTKLDHS